MAEVADALVSVIGPFPTGLLLTLTVLILFVLLAKVCDEAVAPTLEHAAQWLKVPQDVACATFLALGSSAPEIFISCVSTALHGNDTEGAQEISMGTIFGSAIIAFTVIPAMCVFVSPGNFMTLQLVPLFRDSGFYCLGLSMFIVFVRDGQISWRECSVLVAMFGLYLLSMRFLVRFYSSPLEAPSDHVLLRETEMTQSPSKTLASQMINLGIDQVEDLESRPSIATSETAAQSEISNEDEPLSDHSVEHNVEEAPNASRIKRCCGLLLPPFGLSGEGLARKWSMILFIGIVYVALIAEGCLQVTTALASLMGISDHVVGVILVALGAQIPDTFASLAVAKQGEGPGAVANAIGSQVMNILLGLGLPFLVSSAARERDVKVDFASATTSGVALLITIAIFLLLVCRRPLMKRICCRRAVHDQADHDPVYGLSRVDSVILLSVYVGFAIFEIVRASLTILPGEPAA